MQFAYGNAHTLQSDSVNTKERLLYEPFVRGLGTVGGHEGQEAALYEGDKQPAGIEDDPSGAAP